MYVTKLYFADSPLLVYLFVWLELEWKLSDIGAIKTDIEENPWKKREIRDIMSISIRDNYHDSDDDD